MGVPSAASDLEGVGDTTSSSSSSVVRRRGGGAGRKPPWERFPTTCRVCAACECPCVCPNPRESALGSARRTRRPRVRGVPWVTPGRIRERPTGEIHRAPRTRSTNTPSVSRSSSINTAPNRRRRSEPAAAASSASSAARAWIGKTSSPPRAPPRAREPDVVAGRRRCLARSPAAIRRIGCAFVVGCVAARPAASTAAGVGGSPGVGGIAPPAASAQRRTRAYRATTVRSDLPVGIVSRLTRCEHPRGTGAAIPFDELASSSPASRSAPSGWCGGVVDGAARVIAVARARVSFVAVVEHAEDTT